MSSDLAQWVTPVMFILGVLYLDRSIRSVRSDLRAVRSDLRADIKGLRDHMDHQFEDLRDRVGPDEEALDVRRDFFLRNGRGTAA